MINDIINETRGKTYDPIPLTAKEDEIRVIRSSGGEAFVYIVDMGAIMRGDQSTNIELTSGDIVYAPPSLWARVGYVVQAMLFPDLFAKPRVATFDTPQLSSDGGAILLRAVDERLGLTARLAGCLREWRQAGKIEHDLPTLIRQRCYGLACGYPDGNDAARWARDALDMARRLMAEYQRDVTEPLWRNDAGRHNVAGRIALAEGRYQDAIAAFRLLRNEGTGALVGLAQLAEAYDRSGNQDSALAYYERFASTPPAWVGPGAGALPEGRDLLLGPSYQRLGELYQRRGDREKAVDYYNKLIELWKEADDEIQPVVQDVKRRLARLVGEGGPR